MKEQILEVLTKTYNNPILRKTDRVSQIKKVQDYIFMIKGN